ncbi:MAG: sigma-54 dependent transcriptional regulator [Desulfobulbaceae bacterium]|nr:sigma-54 dependent transcriptional regulator [Desulfobulbaceae bacterium]
MVEPFTILAVDDEETMLRVLNRTLSGAGFAVETFSDGKAARDRLRRGGIDLMVTDLTMPEINGFALLEEARAMDPEFVVIVITAFSSVESAVKAMKLGAYDFIPKPFDPEHLLLVVQRAIDNRKLRQENIGLKKVLSERDHLGRIIGVSPAIDQVRRMIDKVKTTDGTVLITGESGTGKELVARAIHYGSGRATKNFVPINCGALPDQLLESELFGYEKGAFSGAVAQKIGLLQLADRGTLFLDEVGTISPMMQVKLLRFMQDRSFMRLGGTDLIQVDVRVLAATNEDLAKAVKTGSFRRDLYYRLNVITIEVPPLRQRLDDIPLLCRHFLDRHVGKTKREISGITPEAMKVLQVHPWEGNVRELENCIEHAVTLSEGEMIDIYDLPPAVRNSKAWHPDGHDPAGAPLNLSLAELEALHIQRVLEYVAGNKSQAARILGIDYTTMLRKLKKIGSDEPDGGEQTG